MDHGQSPDGMAGVSGLCLLTDRTRAHTIINNLAFMGQTVAVKLTFIPCPCQKKKLLLINLFVLIFNRFSFFFTQSRL